MLFDAVFTQPQPDPTVTPMPDIGQVTDFSAAISGFIGAAVLVVAGLTYRQARIWFLEVIADVKVTKRQTTNDHGTNMRDDITGLATSMTQMNRKIDTMHDDLRESRKDTRFNTEYIRDVDKRLNEHQRKHNQGGADV